MTQTAERMVELAGELRDEARSFAEGSGLYWVYNPLDYAWPVHEAYLRRYATGRRRVVFLGMNPGPYGMAQTGVPFGEIASVRDWMGLEGPVGRPPREHPKRPIEGFSCSRSEVSGARLWGLFAGHFGEARAFFKEHYVGNWCPLVFMSDTGRNLTPDKLGRDLRRSLQALCDTHLMRALEVLRPTFAIGVGAIAKRAFERVVPDLPSSPRVASILHPSPASPAANRDWAGQVRAELERLGVWS